MTPYKTTAGRLLTSHRENHRICGTHCWRSKDELISDVLQWVPSHEHASVYGQVRTYLHLFSANTGCSLEDLPGAVDDRDGWRVRVREIRAESTTWCWWWFLTIRRKLFFFRWPLKYYRTIYFVFGNPK